MLCYQIYQLTTPIVYVLYPHVLLCAPRVERLSFALVLEAAWGLSISGGSSCHTPTPWMGGANNRLRNWPTVNMVSNLLSLGVALLCGLFTMLVQGYVSFYVGIGP